jgi:hypothetical protein
LLVRPAVWPKAGTPSNNRHATELQTKRIRERSYQGLAPLHLEPPESPKYSLRPELLLRTDAKY